MTTADTRVRFLDGHSPREGRLGVLAFPVTLDGKEVEFTRLFTVADGVWYHLDFDIDLVSLTNYDDGGLKGWWLLSKRGDVLIVNSGGQIRESIGDAGTGTNKLGYVKRIRVISQSLWVCGYRRQVYRRVDGRWRHIDSGILASKAEIGFVFNDINGRDSSDVYAVGNRGEVFHFDGLAWTQCQTPTNVHLEAVACGENGHTLVVGRSGVALLGDRTGFRVVNGIDPEINFWSAIWFGDRFFASASQGVFQITDRGATLLTSGTPSAHVGYRLCATPQSLWSIGTHQLLKLEGQTWTELRCPDNQ